MSDFMHLSDLAEINPTTPIPGDKTLSFVGMEDVSEQFELLRTHDRALSPGYTRFMEGDILFAKITPCMENGKGAVATGLTNGFGIGSTEFHVLRPRAAESREFIAQWLKSKPLRIAAEAQMTGSAGQRRVPADFFSRFRIPQIALREQRGIAEVLDALDEQIRLSEQVLSKLNAASFGLLVDLMTKGVSRHSTRKGPTLSFHDRRVALPQGWALEPMNTLLAPVRPAMRSGPFGSALLKEELVAEGVPLLGIDNVHINRFEPHFERFVTQAKAKELARYLVRPNDVMITIMGTVGRACLVPMDVGPALSSKHVWTLTIDASRYSPYLVSRQLNDAPWAREHLRRDEQGGIMSAIRSDTLKSLVLPVPPMPEQERIEEVLRAMDQKIAVQSATHAKLRLLKAGLSSDMLSGRVRVATGGTF